MAMPMGMPFGMQPQIILLKEGTDTSQGKPQLISNINACMAVVDTVRTTLGPRGMDKLIHNERVRRDRAAGDRLAVCAPPRPPAAPLTPEAAPRRARSRSRTMARRS
jgi:hypothetical protein